MKRKLNRITIKGFKSIKEINEFELNDLNIIIGANGAGKSNFIQIFHLLSAMSYKGFSQFIREKGGSDVFLYNGPKTTKEVLIKLDFSTEKAYRAHFIPTVDERFLISEQKHISKDNWISYGPPSDESRISDEKMAKEKKDCIQQAMSEWVVYHFQDTGSDAPMRRSEIVEDHNKLRGDASNIAPFLLNLRNKHTESYREIVESIKLMAPFFDDFLLDVISMGKANKVKLNWKQKGSDYPFQPYHFSDGTIRFICLATALLQPTPPSTIVIDEPELGLHPAAIQILSDLIKAAAKKTQVIIATQSPMLIDQFGVEDIIVMTREDGSSHMRRLEKNKLAEWLDEYSLGELWAKNIIEGGPVNE